MPYSEKVKFDESVIRDQLDRMLTSPVFQHSARMSRFLTYVVDQSLSEDKFGLKESLIGVAVFDRRPDYDPKTDPVVRSEARRLREKINQYYSSHGQCDRILIDLPKGGYVAHFDVFPATPPATLSQRQGGTRLVSLLASRLGRGTIATLTLLLVGFIVLRVVESSYKPGFLNPNNNIFRLTSNSACDIEPNLSPDGRQVAFARGESDGRFNIYTMPVSGGEPKRLTSSPWRDLHPAYSPDGKSIAFVRAQPSGLEFLLISASGGKEVKLTEIQAFEWMNWRTHPLIFSGHPGPAWTPDGKSILLCDVAGDQQGGALWAFDIATKMRRQITRPQRIEHDFIPTVSPDGHSIAFVRQISASSRDLYLADFETGVERRLTNDHTDIRGLAWTPDGKSLVFSSNRRGPYQLWRFHLKDTAIDPIAATGDRIFSLTIARNGSMLLYSVATINVSFWRYSLIGEPVRQLTGSKGINLYPRVSPDGRTIAWSSDRSGSWEIWLADSDGGNQRQITRMGERSRGRLLGTPRWSPDGSLIAFDARVEGNSAIYVLPSSGGEPRLVDRNKFEERNPNFSRDGRRLYFNSSRGGMVQLWHRPVIGGPAALVSSRRGYDAVESMDGRTIYYFPLPSEAGIWQVATRDGQASAIPSSVHFQIRRSWDFVRGRFYLFLPEKGPKSLFRFDPVSGTLDEVAVLDHELIFDVNNLAVSPDEKWFVVTRPDALTSDLLGMAASRW